MNMPEKSPASCADDEEPGVLTVDQARQRLVEKARPIRATERKNVRSALDRVLAATILSPIDVPGHTNSAMDGYAFRHADLRAGDATRLRCIGTAFAGKPFDNALVSGECIRIMTGAPIPEGADTVVMQERVRVNDDFITITGQQRTGQNVRRAGEDLAVGEPALSAGKRLAPADLGLLASLGQAEVSVFRRPRVAFFSTGDELRSLGEPLGAGEVYDSNRYTLFGMLAREGAIPRDLGVIPDDPQKLREAFTDAAADSDLILTSGGVSVGGADYTKDVLGEIGEMNFWKIAMKPGRPLTFGRVGDAWFFGLPGNPVAVMVTFYQLVLPFLRHLSGESNWQPLSARARLLEPLRKRPGRTEFLRGILQVAADGSLEVKTTGPQGSGILRSMSAGNCFIVLPAQQSDLAAGELVTVQPFQALV